MLDSEIPSPGELVRHAYRTLEAEREALFRIAVIPVFLQFMIVLLLGRHEKIDLMLLLALVLNLVPVTLFDVAWLRRLLRADAGDPPLPFRWTQRHTGFAVRLALLYLVVFIVFMLPSLLMRQIPASLITLLLFASVVIVFLVILRFSLFFVARAFDHPCELMQSWAATQAGAGRFFWGAVFTFLPAFLVLGIVAGIADGIGIAAALPLVTALVLIVITFIAHALLLAVIARVYEIRMTGLREAEF